MSPREADLPALARRHPDAVTFAAVYLALATLPLVAQIAPELAFRVSTVAPNDIPGAVFLGRTWFWIVLGMVAVGILYTRLHSGELPAGVRRVRIAGIALLAPLCVVAALALAVNALSGSSVTEAGSLAYVPEPSAAFLFRNAAVPGAIIGLGYGVLFHGAIQGQLRDRFGPGEAAAAVTALSGLYRWLVDPAATLARSNALRLAVLALVVATGYATVLLFRIADEPSLSAALTPARIVVLGLPGFLAFGVTVDVLSGATTAAELLVAAAWFAAFGVAAWAYERARSVWHPSLAVAAFQTAFLSAPYVESAAGLAPLG